MDDGPWRKLWFIAMMIVAGIIQIWGNRRGSGRDGSVGGCGGSGGSGGGG